MNRFIAVSACVDGNFAGFAEDLGPLVESSTLLRGRPMLLTMSRSSSSAPIPPSAMDVCSASRLTVVIQVCTGLIGEHVWVRQRQFRGQGAPACSPAWEGYTPESERCAFRLPRMLLR